jgi:transcriptional regulator with XRE-family HTH domain
MGLTQFDLALKLGIHPARISEMETGKRPVPEAFAQRVRAKAREEAVKA